MADDVLLNKAATIERCPMRIEDEYLGYENEIDSNFTRQDSIVLNQLRACEASIDLATHLVRSWKLGLPQERREAFTLLEQAGLLNAALAARMKAMIGFRNVAVHDYQKLNLGIIKSILEKHLDDFRRYTAVALQSDNNRQ
jgi:uncharacterized protein YutE (UPF0331/DUF86 family)